MLSASRDEYLGPAEPNERPRSGGDAVRALLCVAVIFMVFQAHVAALPVALSRLGSPGWAAGAATAIMMGTAVGCHAVAPILIRKSGGTQLALCVGFVGLGASSLLHAIGSSTWLHLGASAVTGAGFGVGVIAAATAVTQSGKQGKLGGRIAAFAVASTVPPIGTATLAAAAVGAGMGTIAFGVLATLSLATLPFTGSFRRERVKPPSSGVPGSRTFGTPLVVAFFLYTMIYGAILSFGPYQLAESDDSPWAFILGLQASLAVGRIGGGPLSERYGFGRAIGFAIAVSAMGTASLLTNLIPLLSGLAIGFGIGTTASSVQVTLANRAEPAHHAAVHAAFNLAWTGGMAIGPLVYVLPVSVAGHTPLLFAVLAAAHVFPIALISQATSRRLSNTGPRAERCP